MAPVWLKVTLIGLYARGLILPGYVAPMGWGTTGLADLCGLPGSDGDGTGEGVGEVGPIGEWKALSCTRTSVNCWAKQSSLLQSWN